MLKFWNQGLELDIFSHLTILVCLGWQVSFKTLLIKCFLEHIFFAVKKRFFLHFVIFSSLNARSDRKNRLFDKFVLFFSSRLWSCIRYPHKIRIRENGLLKKNNYGQRLTVLTLGARNPYILSTISVMLNHAELS